MKVKANISKAACAELIVGEHTETKDNLLDQSQVIFSDYTLTNEDAENLNLKAEVSVSTGGTAEVAKTVTSAVKIQVEGPGDSSKTPCATISEFKTRYGDLIEKYGQELGIDPNVLGAIFFTESSGGGFYDNGKLKIRFEDHIFLNSWAGTNGKYSEYFIHSSTDYSIEAFLLDGVWIKTHSNQPITEYQAFELAKSLDEKAAYNAISMGFGQQMGFNYVVCGYESAKAMFDDYSKGELQQIVGTINFITNYDNGACSKALQNNDYDAFGLKYNGSSGYSKKIQTNIENYKNTK